MAFVFFTRPVLTVGACGQNRASTNKPEAGLPLLVNYLRLHTEQDFLNFIEAIAKAQPEINHFTRRKTWQQN
jgi:hypothetical protein